MKKSAIIRVFFLISILLISCAVRGQTDDEKARKYYIDGWDKVSKKDYVDAIVDLSEAIRRDTGFVQAYENRGVAKFYLQNYQGAIEDFTKALEINPDDYSTYGIRGWAKLRLQDCEGAVDDLTRAIGGTIDNAQYYIIRGQAKYYLQDYEGSLDDFNKVIRSWNNDKYQRSLAFFWRGFIRIDLGQKVSGCLDLRKAAKLGNAMADEIIDMTFCQNK